MKSCHHLFLDPNDQRPRKSVPSFGIPVLYSRFVCFFFFTTMSVYDYFQIATEQLKIRIQKFDQFPFLVGGNVKYFSMLHL